MSTNKKSRERNSKYSKNIAISFVALCIGYFILNYVAALEKPPLGNTFHIVLGCVIIAVSGLFLITNIKKKYFPKKRKRTKHIFLEDQKKES